MSLKPSINLALHKRIETILKAFEKTHLGDNKSKVVNTAHQHKSETIPGTGTNLESGPDGIFTVSENENGKQINRYSNPIGLGTKQ